MKKFLEKLKFSILSVLLATAIGGCSSFSEGPDPYSHDTQNIHHDKDPILTSQPDGKESEKNQYPKNIQKNKGLNERIPQERPLGSSTHLSVNENTGSLESKALRISPVGTRPNASSFTKNYQNILDEALDFCQLSQDLWQKGELENALEALDQAYALILKVDEIEDNPKLMQQKEDLRFMISKRILEIHTSRHIVVNGKHNAIPLTLNKHVKEQIHVFTKGREKKFFIESYKRSGIYRPYILKALKEAGLPPELSWLPLIESGFKVRALSKARALGLWQFIPSTGYKFGLIRNKYIDERLDPIKSTHAAIAYLKELHKIFGDWATVLAAYNCGEGRVLRVIRNQNVNYLDNFWDLYQRLPRETASYVPRFLATLHILNDPDKYGLNSIGIYSPLNYKTVEISKQLHLKNIANAINVPFDRLKALNPELRYYVLPGEKYALRVPPDKIETVLSKLHTIPTSLPPSRAYVYHKIRKGESISTIAKRYNTSIGQIARANNLNRRYTIVAGKTLKIPQKGQVRLTASKNPYTSTHIVKRGDSLWNIARRYGTTTNKIKGLNRLRSSNLHVGQRLKVPQHRVRTLSSNSLKKYRVKRGDSPFKIATIHSMPLERFLRINKLTPRSKIYPGQNLYIE